MLDTGHIDLRGQIVSPMHDTQRQQGPKESAQCLFRALPRGDMVSLTTA